MTSSRRIYLDFVTQFFFSNSCCQVKHFVVCSVLQKIVSNRFADFYFRLVLMDCHHRMKTSLIVVVFFCCWVPTLHTIYIFVCFRWDLLFICGARLHLYVLNFG